MSIFKDKHLHTMRTTFIIIIFIIRSFLTWDINMHFFISTKKFDIINLIFTMSKSIKKKCHNLKFQIMIGIY